LFQTKEKLTFVQKFNDMMYKIGDLVKVVKTNEIKTIIDCENILDVDIYYMSDITSYSENQLLRMTTEEILMVKLENNKEKIINLIDYKKIGKNWAEWYKNH
jgi:hypothetical protein